MSFACALWVDGIDWADVGFAPTTGHNSFDNEVWIVKLVEFVQKVLAQGRVRLIVICFGHQIIGRALGQEVGRSDRGWEVSVTPMQLTAKGKELFGVEELVSPRNTRSLCHTLSRPYH